MSDTAFCIRTLADCLYPHLQLTEDLSDHLTYTRETLQNLGEQIVSANLERMDDAIKEQTLKDWKILDRPRRTLITLVGKITYARRVYLDIYGTRRYLLDEILGIDPYQRFESNAFIWTVRKASDVFYEKTSKAFFDMSGVPITRTTVMRCVHKEGELLDAVSLFSVDGLPISTPVLFGEFDGFWVNLQTGTKQPVRPRRTCKEQFKKKSAAMKVWVAYAGKKKGKRIAPVHWASNRQPTAFFAECMEHTSSAYALEDLDYALIGSDGAGWCKNHSIQESLVDKTTLISKLDTFHVNQKLYRAFSLESDRSEYLNYLYAKDFEGFFGALDKRLLDEGDDERYKQRMELRDYIANNLDWLDNMTLSKYLGQRLLVDLPAVFGDRSFCRYLHDQLAKKRYKRFFATLV